MMMNPDQLDLFNQPQEPLKPELTGQRGIDVNGKWVPGSNHDLRWSGPGTSGKGFFDRDGNLHTWDEYAPLTPEELTYNEKIEQSHPDLTDDYDRRIRGLVPKVPYAYPPQGWTHNENANHRGVQADYRCHFYINPEGEFRKSYGQIEDPYASAIIAADPRHSVEGYDVPAPEPEAAWDLNGLDDMAGHFARIADVNPDQMSLMPEPLSVYEHSTQPFDDDLAHYEKFQGRRPIIYVPARHEVHIGGPNSFHSDLSESINAVHGYYPGWQESERGYIGSPNSMWGGGDLGWYGQRPAEHDQILEALQTKVPELRSAPIQKESEPWNLDGVDDMDFTAHVNWADYTP